MHTRVGILLRILTTITLAGVIICYLTKANKTLTDIFFVLMTIFAFGGEFYINKHKNGH